MHTINFRNIEGKKMGSVGQNANDNIPTFLGNQVIYFTLDTRKPIQSSIKELYEFRASALIYSRRLFKKKMTSKKYWIGQSLPLNTKLNWFQSETLSQSFGDFDPEAHSKFKKLQIYPKFRPGGKLGNHALRSGENLYQEFMSIGSLQLLIRDDISLIREKLFGLPDD